MDIWLPRSAAEHLDRRTFERVVRRTLRPMRCRYPGGTAWLLKFGPHPDRWEVHSTCCRAFRLSDCPGRGDPSDLVPVVLREACRPRASRHLAWSTTRFGASGRAPEELAEASGPSANASPLAGEADYRATRRRLAEPQRLIEARSGEGDPPATSSPHGRTPTSFEFEAAGANQ